MVGPIPVKWKRKEKKKDTTSNKVMMPRNLFKWEEKRRAWRFFAVRCEATDKRSGASKDAHFESSWLVMTDDQDDPRLDLRIAL